MPAPALTVVPDLASPTVPVTFVLLTRERTTEPWTRHSDTEHATYADAEHDQVRLAFAQLDRAAALDRRARLASTPLHRKRLQRAAETARSRDYAIFVHTASGDLLPAD